MTCLRSSRVDIPTKRVTSDSHYLLISWSWGAVWLYSEISSCFCGTTSGGRTVSSRLWVNRTGVSSQTTMLLWRNLTRASAQSCDQTHKHVLTPLRAETKSLLWSCGEIWLLQKNENSNFKLSLLSPSVLFRSFLIYISQHALWQPARISRGVGLLTIIGAHPERSSSYFKAQKRHVSFSPP